MWLSSSVSLLGGLLMSEAIISEQLKHRIGAKPLSHLDMDLLPDHVGHFCIRFRCSAEYTPFTKLSTVFP